MGISPRFFLCGFYFFGKAKHQRQADNQSACGKEYPAKTHGVQGQLLQQLTHKSQGSRCRIRKQIKDETTVEVIMLIGDGLYYNNALGSGIMNPESPEFSALMDKVYTLLPKQ